ncbi:MAG: hypothetical protein K0M49_13385 [Arenimonas sp.]|nr:hypothetical protein [Arenimonas sp.]
MGGDAASGFQDVAGDCEFVGRCADIPERVVQDEVLEMDEFTVDPERSMHLKEMGTLEKALTDRRTCNSLVEAGERDRCLGNRPQQALDGQFREIVILNLW